MEILVYEYEGQKIAGLKTMEPVILTVEDALDLIGNSGYLGAERVIVHESNLPPHFFDLKTRLAGEILQKFSNYRMKLAVVGNFNDPQSKSLRDFIFESNKTGRIVFAESVEEAKRLLTIN